jgi:glycosyltransferase involved in cell wall biosynthesis
MRSARKINILFAIPNFITAGSGREMFNIIERLDKATFNPIIAIQQEGGALYDEIKQKGYRIITAPFIANNTGLISGLLNAIRNARLFKQLNIDIWQSFNWSSDYTEAITARLCGAKYVYVKKNMNWGRKAWQIKSYVASAIVARNTSLIKHIFNSSTLRKKTHFITGAVDADKFKPRQSENSLANSTDNLTVCCIAQLIRLKGQDTLIKAIAKLDHVNLVLTGSTRDEAYRNELDALIQSMGIKERVTIIEYTPSQQLLGNIDVFVLPTNKLFGHEEGCPVALLEAMATGLPCIASNVAGNIDLIQHEETGLLFEVDDADALAEQIYRVQQDKGLSKQLGIAARQKVVANHTLEKEAADFSKLYLQLAGR